MLRMGAEVTMWVEVEVRKTLWRESYGVTSDEATENVKLDIGESTTGRVRHEYELEESDDDY